jgi:hypothetical protein
MANITIGIKMKLSPVKAIRIKCLECAGRPKDIRLCANIGCPLHVFRFGTNPARKGIGGKPTHLKDTVTPHNMP